MIPSSLESVSVSVCLLLARFKKFDELYPEEKDLELLPTLKFRFLMEAYLPEDY